MTISDEIQLLGVSITNAIKRAKDIATQVHKQKLPIGREIALVITKLEEAEDRQKRASEQS